ncbi:hypothetical protein C8Q72DRAFT_888258 [Fomitopsis betulina]|nr:hypothetical protein C8Q72DRAFT_888258 [Fomitopsis betulina]
MKVPRSPFRRPSAHSAPAAGYKQKKALFIGTKYDTPGSPQGDTFGKHDDVLAVQRLLIAIVPMDHSGSGKKHQLIMDNWLRRNLIDPLKPGVQLVAILDACHSGTLLGKREAVWAYVDCV